MQFAFIVPTYNYANRIAACLDSILQQAGDDYEIIIADDGSTDNTKDVIQRYQEQYPQIIHYFYQENQGPAAARNLAVKHATAEFIFPLDADDQLLPDTLTIMRKAVQSHPQMDFIIAGHISIFTDGKKKTSFNKPLHNNRENNFISFLCKKISVHQGTYIMRRKIFDTLKFPEKIAGREDIIFIAQVFALFDAMTIQQPIVEIIKHEGSFRHQKNKHTGKFEIIKQLFNPAILPSAMMKYKSEYASRLYLSFFRDYYLAKEYRTARKWYYRAIKTNPLRLLQWSYLSKFIRSFFKKEKGHCL